MDTTTLPPKDDHGEVAAHDGARGNPQDLHLMAGVLAPPSPSTTMSRMHEDRPQHHHLQFISTVCSMQRPPLVQDGEHRMQSTSTTAPIVVGHTAPGQSGHQSVRSVSHPTPRSAPPTGLPACPVSEGLTFVSIITNNRYASLQTLEDEHFEEPDHTDNPALIDPVRSTDRRPQRQPRWRPTNSTPHHYTSSLTL